jgi:S-(hydroxymethyl)glutathione dehydrogenase / alcohol dehydrogenase
MRAAIFVEQHQDLSLEDVTALPPGPRDVVVSVRASGVCQSDQAVIDRMPGGNPMILGHEACGVVEWIGAEVSRVRPGQRVIVALTPVCGKCWFCLRQETHLCEMGAEVFGRHRAERSDGSRANAMSGVGSFADVMTVDEASCIPVETDLPADQLALIGCGFTTGFGAAVNTAPVTPGATVAVIGCGGVGLAVVQGAKLAGASRIVAVDVAAEKLELARVLGATDVVDATAGDPVEQVRDLTRGVDYAFSAIGAPSGLTQAVRMCAYAGWATLVGIPPYDVSLDVDLYRDLFAPKVGISVTHGGDTIPQQDFPFLAQAALDGKLDLARFVSETISLEDAPAALERVGREGIRTVAVL